MSFMPHRVINIFYNILKALSFDANLRYNFANEPMNKSIHDLSEVEN